MSYISREVAIAAVKRMKGFHEDIVKTYTDYGMDLLDNLGRRNIVMSQVQETFFAQELGRIFSDVKEDGRTGQPDIIIGEIDREVECKLTSRHKTGAISFSTDHGTLAQKGELDYLYVVCDREFKKFCVIHFEKLTVEHFRHISPGARGKVAMKKYLTIPEAHVLVGDVVSMNHLNIQKIKKTLEHCSPTTKKFTNLKKRLAYWEDVPEKYNIILESA